MLHDGIVLVVKGIFFHGNIKTLFTDKGSVPESAVNHM